MNYTIASILPKHFPAGNELYFAKVKPNAIIPTKDDENAGYDIYACFDEDYMIIEPHTTKLIPTGIAVAMDSKWYMQLEERGSTGSKGIKKSAGVIDSGYRSEIFAAITNTNSVPIAITKVCFKDLDNMINYPYEKAICQGIIHPVPTMDTREISYEELCSIESKRGTGALGSSGK